MVGKYASAQFSQEQLYEPPKEDELKNKVVSDIVKGLVICSLVIVFFFLNISTNTDQQPSFEEKKRFYYEGNYDNTLPTSTGEPAIDKADAVAFVNGQYIPKSELAELEKEVAERGHGQTFPKEKLIEELIQRELLVQDAIQKQLDKTTEFMVQLEAAKKALQTKQKQSDKSPELMMAQLETAKKTLLTQADVQNFIKANPVTEAENQS